MLTLDLSICGTKIREYCAFGLFTIHLFLASQTNTTYICGEKIWQVHKSCIFWWPSESDHNPNLVGIQLLRKEIGENCHKIGRFLRLWGFFDVTNHCDVVCISDGLAIPESMYIMEKKWAFKWSWTRLFFIFDRFDDFFQSKESKIIISSTTTNAKIWQKSDGKTWLKKPILSLILGILSNTSMHCVVLNHLMAKGHGESKSLGLSSRN